jgi:translation initiation factor IF-2
VRILHSGVGDISESDVHLVSANDGILIGFNVKADVQARRSCDSLGVTPEFFSVIYDVMDRISRSLAGLGEPEYRDIQCGEVEVRTLFKISRIGTVAGSYVTDGKVARSHTVQLWRENEQLWEGKIKTLKRFKDDVREVAQGYECGVVLEGYNGLNEGDRLLCFARELVESA